MGKISTFTLPSSAAPNTSCATSLPRPAPLFFAPFEFKNPSCRFSGDTQTETQASYAIGNDPRLYAHMPWPALRSHTKRILARARSTSYVDFLFIASIIIAPPPSSSASTPPSSSSQPPCQFTPTPGPCVKRKNRSEATCSAIRRFQASLVAHARLWKHPRPRLRLIS